ncbi:MAG: VWA domain-containing protein [Vicinamibacterales bacterium]
MKTRLLLATCVGAAWLAGILPWPAPTRTSRILHAAGQTAGTPPGAQTAPPPPPPQTPENQQPVFQTGINFVRVDVIVSDKDGKPVLDLDQADFEVLEDGKPQKVESFKLIKLTGTPEPGGEPAREIRSDYVQESEARRDDVRMFVIFLDDYHVRKGASLGVRDPLMRFLQNEVGPLDMVALMYPLTPSSDLRFSRNRDLLAGAIQKFEGRKYEYEPRNQFEAQYSNYPVETVERIRNEVSLSALKALVTHLGGMREGRKAVIVVSEGYSYYVPPQLRSGNAQMLSPGRSDPTLGENDSREDTARFFSQTDVQSDLRNVYSAANRANTAFYTLDPRGLAVFEFDINEGVGFRQDQTSLRETQDTLRVLAEQTDGRAIVNRNDLATGLKQIVQDSSGYYLLGYNSTQAPSDGKFHEIRVRVKRPKVDVRARKGYWALTATETARATAPAKPVAEGDKALGGALAALDVPARARLVRTWMGSAKGENGKTHVTFVWEAVPPTVANDRRGTPARISLTAAGEQGLPYYRGKVPAAPLSSGSNGAPGSAAGSTSSPSIGRVEFDAPPGPAQLRLSIEGDAGQVLDTDIVEVKVPDFTAPQALLSTPAMFRARTLPEFKAVAANPQALPTTDRSFRRTERLLLRFSLYGPTGDTPVVARLLGRTGNAMSELTIDKADAAGGPVRQVNVPLATLPNGEYLVEITAGAGDDTRRELVAFRVAG